MLTIIQEMLTIIQENLDLIALFVAAFALWKQMKSNSLSIEANSSREFKRLEHYLHNIHSLAKTMSSDCCEFESLKIKFLQQCVNFENEFYFNRSFLSKKHNKRLSNLKNSLVYLEMYFHLNDYEKYFKPYLGLKINPLNLARNDFKKFHQMKSSCKNDKTDAALSVFESNYIASDCPKNIEIDGHIVEYAVHDCNKELKKFIEGFDAAMKDFHYKLYEEKHLKRAA